MIIKTYNENHEYLLFFDIEFNNSDLVQFAALLFKKIDNEIYQLMRSFNQYVTTKVCYPFADYTAITNNFLEENGIPIKDLIELIRSDLLADVEPSQLEVISHGLKNDRLVLMKNGINLSNYTEGIKQYPIDGYCTFNNAKRILGRENRLTAEDICNECGYYLHNAHNAYNDVWGEVAIFTYLKKVEAQGKESN